MNLSSNKPSGFVNRYEQNGCDALDAVNTDAVIGGKVSEAVCNQTVVVAFHCPDDVWAMAEDQIGASVDHHAREFDDVATRFAVIFLLAERQVHYVASLGTTVERDDYDVVGSGTCGDRLGRLLVFEQQV